MAVKRWLEAILKGLLAPIRERRTVMKASEREGSTYFYFGSVLWRATDYGWLDRRLLPRGNPDVVLGLSE